MARPPAQMGRRWPQIKAAQMARAQMVRAQMVRFCCNIYIRNSVILSTLSYASETWTWNAAQQSRIQAVEMSYIQGACGVSRRDGESNEDTYERFGMSEAAVGMDCGVVEWVK